MKVFSCEACGRLLHFENSTCLGCGAALGFLPAELRLATLAAAGSGRWTRPAAPAEVWKSCANAEDAGCNWLLPAGDAAAFCDACELNRTIPDLAVAGNRERWQAMEAAKRRLIYALKRLGLPLTNRRDDGARGLAFDFLADAEGAPVMTGHADGLVTINIAEADSPERERRRLELGEPYRTLLGHLRHEVGHYYWDLLIRDAGGLEPARSVFGDERADYAAALERNYRDGPPPGWESTFVSAYAAAHPWEDFAETWSHYLHIVDTLDTAASFGLAVDPLIATLTDANAVVRFDPYAIAGFEPLVDAWVPLTVAVNSLNRSMGQPDLYPFVLSEPVIAKLGFIHGLVRAARR